MPTFSKAQVCSYRSFIVLVVEIDDLRVYAIKKACEHWSGVHTKATR